jgi:hypothetical protein
MSAACLEKDDYVKFIFSVRAQPRNTDEHHETPASKQAGSADSKR